MLTEKEFYCYVEHHILEYVSAPEHKQVRVQKVYKNNQVRMTGLSIGTKEEHLQPVLYLESYYQRYLYGEELKHLMGEIGAAYEEYQMDFSLNENQIKSYDYIRKNLFVRLVNYRKNRGMLEYCPYDRLEDLAVTYRWTAYRNHCGMASAVVKKSDLPVWGVSEEKMKKDALENAQKIFPPSIKRIQNVIPVHVEEGSLPIYVLSNKDYMNGASAILYQKVMKDFSDAMESNLYILPSSIHEVILLLEKDISDVKGLFEMVAETNRAMVGQEEILSDNVYYYDRDTCQITIAK
jgi:hypothetical protein